MAVVAAALAFALLPASASAQTGEIRIQQAEMLSASGFFDQFNITGSGQCASAGQVFVQAEARDLDTRATTFFPQVEVSQCLAPGEHINWMVTESGFSFAQFRAGDRLLVTAEAIGAITDLDAREVILKRYR
jgi:hypothetical protein